MNIAIIEDSPINLLVMQSLVKCLGEHDCSVFTDPELGLGWCQHNSPDLIIVDYMMPGLDGLEFIRRCRATADLQDLPILMVTAAVDRKVRYAALEAGATDFLTKPIDRHEFIPRVRNMLQLRASMVATAHRADELSAAVRQAVEEIHLRERETIMRLARAAELRDPETGTHITRMTHYSATLARKLNLPDDFVEMLLSAAPMHDIGKIGTPDHILLKPGRLTDEEMEIMRRHTTIGYEILRNSASPMLQMAAEIALSHHEKYDGSGYPFGKSGKDIPLTGRIVAVADVFDALTSDRPYKQAWDLDRARDYLIEGRGCHFDPEFIDLFIGNWEEILDIHQRFQG
jgi:response regulator RpfG family c-di-GMP phosphodiesterase